jgi:hypothetical protein
LAIARWPSPSTWPTSPLPATRSRRRSRRSADSTWSPNVAGYGNLGPIEDTSIEDFHAQIETNLFGVINISKAAIPTMRKQHAGHIITFSSVGGRIGSTGRAPYSAAKFGVESFSEVMGDRDGAAWGEGHHHRAEWLSDGFRRFVNDDPARPTSDFRQDGLIPGAAGNNRRAARVWMKHALDEIEYPDRARPPRAKEFLQRALSPHR